MIAMNKDEKINELRNTNSLYYQGNNFNEAQCLKNAEVDFNIIQERVKALDQVPGPRVGDFLNIAYGKYVRFTHHWGDCLQTGSTTGSYYLNSGSVSFSGGLDSAIPLKYIEPYDYEPVKEGSIWIFSKGWPKAHSGVYLTVPFRVFRISRQQQVLTEIEALIKNDRMPEDHPLFICDKNSPQWQGALTEYYFYRNAYKMDEMLIKGCEINRSGE